MTSALQQELRCVDGRIPHAERVPVARVPSEQASLRLACGTCATHQRSPGTRLTGEHRFPGSHACPHKVHDRADVGNSMRNGGRSRASPTSEAAHNPAQREDGAHGDGCRQGQRHRPGPRTRAPRSGTRRCARAHALLLEHMYRCRYPVHGPAVTDRATCSRDPSRHAGRTRHGYNVGAGGRYSNRYRYHYVM
eukprot:scaffold653_cov379-Prasinococcus_capsulatus_cf.AAC.7